MRALENLKKIDRENIRLFITKNSDNLLLLFNITLLYLNPYLWLIGVFNIVIIRLYKNHTFEISVKIIERKNSEVKEICAGEFTEVDNVLYNEDGREVDPDTLKEKVE